MEVSYFCHPLDVVAMGHSRYPDGVKFIVASFENYFGNVTGTDLRTWCIRHSWVLAWTHVALGDPRRLIDPVVAPATKVNASLSAAYVAAFSSLWSQAQSSWNASQMNLQNHTHWKTLVNETATPGAGDALVWPIGAADCEDGDNCIGATHSSGECICYVGRS
eukprot:INCI10259.1.p1 GENE.INCI10259.1~~INCI10259.1.p1  ORF type:complete len:163 (-),score=22.19 INCI10259.1:46-534(-)